MLRFFVCFRSRVPKVMKGKTTTDKTPPPPPRPQNFWNLKNSFTKRYQGGDGSKGIYTKSEFEFFETSSQTSNSLTCKRILLQSIGKDRFQV